MRFRRPRAAGTVACDLVTVETVGLSGLCVVVGIEVERRTVQLAGPPRSRAGGGWTGRARNVAIGLDEHTDRRFRFPIRDRDTTFRTGFDAVFAAAGVGVLKIWPRSPRADAFAQRWVRTVRTECPDWIPIRNERQLHRVLAAYLAHYNRARPHRGLGLDPLVPPVDHGQAGAGDAVGRIERLDVRGGLVHDYRRAA